MLKVEKLTLGAYATNCYIVYRTENPGCVVIDPGYTPEIVLAKAQALGKSVEAILLTHGHFDHVGGVKAIAQATACPVYLCAADTALPERMTAGTLYYTDAYAEGDTVTAAGISFQVRQTPGHTPGSVCLIAEDKLFTGDTLFCDSRGRTDLPGGSVKAIKESLARLAALPGDYGIYPGHGDGATLDGARMYNPFLGAQR